MVSLLSTTYFGPVAWYKMLHRADMVCIEAHENYQKQTFRNRCTIGSEAGPLSLTVPVSEPPCNGNAPRDRRITSMLVSDHGNWRHLHWQALTTAYRDTPFFPYYADDLRPFFERRDWPTLWQLNEATRDVVCRLLGIHPHIIYTQQYQASMDNTQHFQANSDNTQHFQAPPSTGTTDVLDLRNAFSPKPTTPRPSHDNCATPQPQQKQPAAWAAERPYWQPFLQRHGFMPGLSILDLLFCMGPEARLYL